MKKITILIALLLTVAAEAQAQGGGNGNGNGNGNQGNGNNWGQNGNGNAYGQGNGNGNNGNGNGNGNGNSNNGNGNGNGNQGNGNNWGQNGNGNAFGQGNGGGNNGGSSNGASSGASQTARLGLSNAIEITFTGSGSAMGADVTMPFATVNDYANGVESAAQELKVRSNKNFSVAVKTNATNFTYSGNTTPAPSMPVNGVLALRVTNNSTGGSIANSFSASSYATLTSSNQGLIANASRGGNQRFSVKYKTTPGFAYPAGTYSVDVIYTATQQ